MALVTVCLGDPQFAMQTVAGDEENEGLVNGQEVLRTPRAGLRNEDKKVDLSEQLAQWATICSGNLLLHSDQVDNCASTVPTLNGIMKGKGGWKSLCCKESGISFHMEIEKYHAEQNTRRKR